MEAAVPRLVYCGPEPIRFSVSSRRSFVSGIPHRNRSRRILAVATDPKPTQTTPPTVNGSSSSSKGVNNNVSKRINDVSKEIKRVRAQMEEDEQLSVLMRGLRGQNLMDSVFADVNIQLSDVAEASTDSTRSVDSKNTRKLEFALSKALYENSF